MSLAGLSSYLNNNNQNPPYLRVWRVSLCVFSML